MMDPQVQKDSPSADPELLRDQLGNVVTLQTTQNQIVWTVFGVFWAAEVVLLAALFTTGKLAPDKGTIWTVGIIGVLLSAVWLAILTRAIAYAAFYERIIHELEVKLRIPAKFAVSREINRSAFEKGLRGFSVRGLMLICSGLSGLAWLGLLFRFGF